MSVTRGQIILFSCLAVSVLLTMAVTYFLARTSHEGSIIRDQGPEHHKVKAKTPDTGGRAFLVTLALVGFPGAILLTDPRGLIGITIGLLTGMIGLADDILKRTKNDTSGLKARYKLPLQIIVGLLLMGAIHYLVQDDTVKIPFIAAPVNLGAWKILLGLFCYLTIINAVNFTDGIDGLAGTTMLVAAVFLGLAILSSGTEGSVIVPVVLIGMCAGFLPSNWNPARIFMGDAGSLALSGALAAAAIATGLEIVLLIIGLVFIIEIASVVLQVVYFRLTGGKRIFRMTPIHHAWELRGYREPVIVAGATVLGIVAGVIGWWSSYRGV